MTTMEALPIMRRILFAYPALSGDEDRQSWIMREMERFSRTAGEQAATEYVDQGHGHFNPDQFLAIARRIDAQAADLHAQAAKLAERESRRRDEDGYAADLKAADERIRVMGDDEIRAVWAPIFAGMTGLAREWAAKWTMEQIRSNRHVRGAVAAQIRDERNVAQMA